MSARLLGRSKKWRLPHGKRKMKRFDKLVVTICALGFLLCWTGIVRGQDKPEPVITSEMREAYFQAKADVLEAQAVLEAAQKRFQAAVEIMTKTCPLILDAQGKPQCAPKPEPPEER